MMEGEVSMSVGDQRDMPGAMRQNNRDRQRNRDSRERDRRRDRRRRDRERDRDGRERRDYDREQPVVGRDVPPPLLDRDMRERSRERGGRPRRPSGDGSYEDRYGRYGSSRSEMVAAHLGQDLDCRDDEYEEDVDSGSSFRQEGQNGEGSQRLSEEAYGHGMGREHGREGDRSLDKWLTETPTNTVMLRGLPQTVDENDIKAELMLFGAPIKEVRLMKRKDTGVSRGFAFVEFQNVADAQRWMDHNQV